MSFSAGAWREYVEQAVRAACSTVGHHWWSKLIFDAIDRNRPCRVPSLPGVTLARVSALIVALPVPLTF